MVQVVWTGPVMDPSGYGEASRNYAIGLRHPGFRYEIVPKYFWSGTDNGLDARWAQLMMEMGGGQVDTSKPYVLVQHMTPDTWSLVKGCQDRKSVV